MAHELMTPDRARYRRILVQRSIRSDAIVIVGVGFQDPTQMRLAPDHHMIRTLAPNRSDQPFGKAILPGARLVRSACREFPWHAAGV
jgi:hypothetical protein